MLVTFRRGCGFWLTSAWAYAIVMQKRGTVTNLLTGTRKIIVAIAFIERYHRILQLSWLNLADGGLFTQLVNPKYDCD